MVTISDDIHFIINTFLRTERTLKLQYRKDER